MSAAKNAAHLAELRRLAERARDADAAMDPTWGEALDHPAWDTGVATAGVVAWHAANKAFAVAVTYDVVLGLLDEIEALRAACGAPCGGSGPGTNTP